MKHLSFFKKNLQHALKASCLTLCAGALLLSGCSTYDNTTRALVSNVTPYRINIIQGNVITSEQLAKIQAGMSKDAVISFLGSPSINSIVTPQEINYVFSYKKGYATVVEQSTVTIMFDAANLVSSVKSSNILSEQTLIKQIDAQ